MTADVDHMYQHVAEPKAVKQRRKAKAQDETQYTANIMFDRRVVRGNTYAAQILPADAGQQESRPARPAAAPKSTAPQRRPARTPEPVEGRRHVDLQTDTYLEELTEVVPEADSSTQTDAFLDRPLTPLFVPPKRGLDAYTQIESGDLFDFDLEVEPILEVLVGKTLEQGLMEVMEEEELSAMRAHQEHFEQLRNAELVATQRMEAAEKRKVEEKERRLAQERERLEREHLVREKVAAATFARGYLTGMMNTVMRSLVEEGHFYDPVEKEVEEEFIPWLKTEALGFLDRERTVRQVVGTLATEALALQAKATSANADELAVQAAALQAVQEAEAAASKALQEQQAAAQLGRASHILSVLKPPVVEAEAIEQQRTDLVTKAEETANAAYETAKQAAGDEARAKAQELREKQEAELAEQQAAAAEAREEAAPEEAAPEEGAETDEAAQEKPAPQLVDPEEEAQKAMDAVEMPAVKEVTDADVLSALLDNAVVTKEAITQCLAIELM